MTAKLDVNGSAHSLDGQGDGPVEAFVAALVSEFGSSVGGDFDVLDYAEHAIGQGADARAVAYIETVDANGNIRWGIGTDPNITTASLRAVLAELGELKARLARVRDAQETSARLIAPTVASALACLKL